METLSLDMEKFNEEFSFENLRKRMSLRLQKVRRINHPEEYENQQSFRKEDNTRQK